MRQKSAEEREAYVAQQIAMRDAKRLAQQQPQLSTIESSTNSEPLHRTKAESSVLNLVKARKYRHIRDIWAPKPMTSTERSRKRRALLSAQHQV